MRYLALLAGLGMSMASCQAQATLSGGLGGGGIDTETSFIVSFEGTCTVDCNVFSGATAQAELGIRSDYIFGASLESGDVTSFNYSSQFGPFSSLPYVLSESPVYTVTSASGIIPALANPTGGLPGASSPASVFVSGTVTGLLGTISQLDGQPLLEDFTFNAANSYNFAFQTSTEEPGSWSMSLSEEFLPVAASADAGTAGAFFLNSAVSQQGPGDGEVPEPGAIALFAIGLLGLGVARRRR